MTILRWPGRDALPPVQEWSVSAPVQCYRDQRISVEQVQVSIDGGTPFPHQVIRFASESVAVVVHNRDSGVLMLYRHRLPVAELFSLMSDGLISAQPSMLALLYAERAGLFKE